MIEKDTSELIDRYLNGELEGKDLEIFNSKYIDDSEFAKEVKLQEEVNQIMLETRFLELKDNINNDIKDNGPRFTLGRIVGSIIIIILLAISYSTLKETDKVKLEKMNKVSDLVLTPNGDGQNDEVFISEQGIAKIYDRNGKMIRALSSPSTWDDTLANGQMSPTGLYVVKINNGKSYTVKMIR